MSTLSDIIGRVIELSERPGLGIDTHRAGEMAVPLIKNDPEALDMAVREAATKRIKDQATAFTRRFTEASASEHEQIDMFDRLRPRHALDLEGRSIKNTRDLTRIEFRRLITIREEQVAADMAYLQVLREAEVAVSLLWDFHPAMSFGQVADLYMMQRSAAD